MQEAFGKIKLSLSSKRMQREQGDSPPWSNEQLSMTLSSKLFQRDESIKTKKD